MNRQIQEKQRKFELQFNAAQHAWDSMEPPDDGPDEDDVDAAFKGWCCMNCQEQYNMHDYKECPETCACYEEDDLFLGFDNYIDWHAWNAHYNDLKAEAEIDQYEETGYDRY